MPRHIDPRSAMKNRPCWSAIWPAVLAREKRNVLINMDFEYDP
jgi:hypothetical protein